MINGIRRNGPNERTNKQTNRVGRRRACVFLLDGASNGWLKNRWQPVVHGVMLSLHTEEGVNPEMGHRDLESFGFCASRFKARQWN